MSEDQSRAGDSDALSISSCLRDNKARVLSIWEKRVRASLPAAPALDSPSLINSLPGVIDGLVDALAAPSPQKYLQEGAKELGREHGAHRSKFRNYELTQVIEEYYTLRHVILEVLRKCGTVPEGATDIITDTISIGIRNAASEFAQVRARQLNDALNEAEKANIAKGAFLANMSHEIRTPLGAILGFAELLREAQSDQVRAEYFSVISRNGKALIRIIDDILDLARVEAGRMSIEHISFRLDEFMEELSGIFQDTAKAKNISLTATLDPATPKIIKSDPRRLRQILINLVGNAVKFTPEGSINVQVEPVVVDGAVSKIRFIIEDTGIGMTREQARLLFEPFSQIDASATRKFGGSGLGLALSRRLAKALGGDVEIVKCAPGAGCVVVATVQAFPVGDIEGVPGPRQGRTPDESAELRKVKILLVDDSPDNRALVKLLLEKEGIEVDLANDGLEGMRKALAGAYDLVLMDMQMPVMDGYLATKQLRDSGYKVPIVALTAHAMLDENRKILAAGCDFHLTKPIDSRLLIETVANFTTLGAIKAQ